MKDTLKKIQTPGKGETSLLHNAMMLDFEKPDLAKLRQQSARPGAKSKDAQNVINEMYASKVYHMLNKTAQGISGSRNRRRQTAMSQGMNRVNSKQTNYTHA